jgi:hypothetical protein
VDTAAACTGAELHQGFVITNGVAPRTHFPYLRHTPIPLRSMAGSQPQLATCRQGQADELPI